MKFTKVAILLFDGTWECFPAHNGESIFEGSPDELTFFGYAIERPIEGSFYRGSETPITQHVVGYYYN